MATEITDDFNEPYYKATVSLSSSFSPSVVGIAGVPYLLDTNSGEYKREAFDVVQQRNTNSQRDVLLLPQDVWRQQMESWHQGAGQQHLDRDDALPYRFYQSFGIDPWTKWQCSLLPETLALYGTAGLSGKIWLSTYDTYLAVINDDTIYWYDELSVGSTASAGSTVVHTSPVIDIANLGAYVTTLHADGNVWETAGPGATPVLKGDYDGANFIAYEKDFLIAGVDNKLRDITAGGAGTLVYTSPLANFRWQSAAPGNSCIYALGGSGDKYLVHRLGIKPDGTGLAPAIVAATLPDGEIGYCIEMYLGFVLIGTSKGVRVAVENNTSGDLTLGPIIPTDKPVKCFEGQDRFVWYGNAAINALYSEDDEYFPKVPVCGLSRLDLSTTTTTQLTPAYATDISAVPAGSEEVTSVVTYQDKRVFTVSNNGVFFEGINRMQAGWLKQGTMSFGIEDLKTGLYVQAKYHSLHGEIDLDISYDSSGYVRLVDLQQQGSIRSGNISLNGTQFSRVDSRYVLRRDPDDHTRGAEFSRWEIRAIPVKGRTSRWYLPVMNYEDIEIDMVKYTRDPLAVLENLIGLVQTGVLFTLQESGNAYQVHGKTFQWQPEKLTINGKSWQGVLTLVVEEVQ